MAVHTTDTVHRPNIQNSLFHAEFHEEQESGRILQKSPKVKAGEPKNGAKIAKIDISHGTNLKGGHFHAE